ncbi:DinB family protein [uncultured Brevibacillus sp.]|uniref:DinB family protein n=1 Tax=uncultured Brevibacillus sp. TaxID=169970 RepID=UPI0025928E02|nr:DinB family protein [uncultured Brevibacillus sp.]
MEKRHEVLFRQLQDYRSETLHAVEGLTEEEVNIVPKGFNNNILWNLGHIYLDQYLWISHITKDQALIPYRNEEVNQKSSAASPQLALL